MKSQLEDMRRAYDDAVADSQADDGYSPILPTPSLSSFNMYEHTKVTTAPKFEKYVASLSEADSSQCGVIYVRQSPLNIDEIDISDIPFPLDSADTAADTLIAGLQTEGLTPLTGDLLPIFSLSSSNPTSSLPPMSSIPSKPVLSVPEYLDSINDTLFSYSPTLRTCFEQVLLPYVSDVFPRW